MKVLLINPWQGDLFPPPAIGYLQAVLKQAGVKVTAMDLDDALFWNREAFDVVAVSFHSFSAKYAPALRRKYEKTRMICGGHHSSALPQQMLNIGYDQVCVGEGENVIMDMLNGKDSIVYGSGVDPNMVPYPVYTGLGGDWSWGIPIISSRGCPFTCSFCASSDFWKRKWKPRSAENVVDEIVKSGYKKFMFEDDNFTLKKDRAIEICRKLQEIGGYSWQCASRAETLQDEELCLSLKKAGCFKVWLGCESFSQDSLDRNNKNTTVEQMVKGIKTAHKYGLQVMAQFIVGLPDDSRKDIDITRATIRTLGLRRGEVGAGILWILPNTEAHVRAKQKGFNDNTFLDTNSDLLYTYEQDRRTLQHWLNLIKTA